jgi:glyoxylase-like metal-dependent hydrolase (beta-lactamase superfamily II)
MINVQPSFPIIIPVGALATNCLLYPLPEDFAVPGQESRQPCAVIDPGADADIIIARMEQLNLYPQGILLTHGHFDHLAAIPGIVDYYRSTYQLHLEIMIHQEDAASLGLKAYQVHRDSFTAAAGNAAYVDALWEPLPSPTRLLAEGDTIGPFKVLHLPGHSPGSIGFYAEAEKILFSGDTLFNCGMGRTDLPGGDWETLRRSLKRLFALEGSVKVYPGHGLETTIGKERNRIPV